MMKASTLFISTLLVLAGIIYGYQHWFAIAEIAFDKEEQLYYSASPQGFNGMTNIPLDVVSQWEAYDAKLAQQTNAAGGSPITKLDNVTEIGPFNVGGRTRALMIDQSNPCRYFVGGITGGLWISEDCGQSWEPVDDFGATLSVSSIIQDPSNPDKIYYGTGEFSNTFIGNGIYYSPDGGNTFQQLLSNSQLSSEFVLDMVHSKSDAQTFFVTTDKGIFRVTNAGSGLTFSQVLTTSGAVTDIEDLGSGIVIAGSNEGVVYRSNDNGVTFQSVTSGLPNSGSRVELAYAHSEPGIVYAVIAATDSLFDGLYKSTDFATSFTKISDLTGDTLLEGDELDDKEETESRRRQLEYDLEIAIHPDDPERILLGYVILRYSPDGGNTWQKVEPGHLDQHIIVFPSQGEPQDHFLLGNDGGVYKKYWSDLEGPPVDLNHGLRITQIYNGYYYPEGSDYLVLGGAQDNGSFRISTNFEVDKFETGDGSYAAISQSNPDIAFLTGQTGLFSLKDANQPNYEFSQINMIDGALFRPPVVIDPTNDRNIFYASFGRIWQSSDQGMTWRPITKQYSDPAKGLAEGYDMVISPDGKTLYAYLNSELYKVPVNNTPGNEQKLIPKSGSAYSKVRIDPHNPDALYTISGNQLSYITNINTSNLKTIQLSDELPENLPIYDVAVDPLNASNIFVSTYYGLYFTQDNGQHWSKDESIPNVPCTHLEIRPTDRKLFVFTFGRGIWMADINTHTYFPYSTSFESQNIGPEWSKSLGFNSVIRHEQNEGGLHQNKRVILDRKDENFTSATKHSLPLDFSTAHPDSTEELLLTFLYTSQNNHQNTNVSLLEEGGSNFLKILHDLRPTVSSGENERYTGVPVTVNLSKIAEKYNFSLSGESIIQFNHRADADSTSHGSISYDMIRLYSQKLARETVPYVLDFNQ
ncbi:MAG: hypothetical protein RIG62_15355 [Cyclobacteriaceae bacterium]